MSKESILKARYFKIRLFKEHPEMVTDKTYILLEQQKDFPWIKWDFSKINLTKLNKI